MKAQVKNSDSVVDVVLSNDWSAFRNKYPSSLADDIEDWARYLPCDPEQFMQVPYLSGKTLYLWNDPSKTLERRCRLRVDDLSSYLIATKRSAAAKDLQRRFNSLAISVRPLKDKLVNIREFYKEPIEIAENEWREECDQYGQDYFVDHFEDENEEQHVNKALEEIADRTNAYLEVTGDVVNDAIRLCRHIRLLIHFTKAPKLDNLNGAKKKAASEIDVAKEDLAIATLSANTGWTHAKVANHIGVHVQTLYGYQRYMKCKRLLREAGKSESQKGVMNDKMVDGVVEREDE